MRVLVTGAAGFLGCNVVRVLLGQGCEVYAVTRPTTDLWRIRDLGLHLVVCDLQDFESALQCVQTVRPQVCYHFAWADGADLNSFDNANHLRPSMDFARMLAEAGCERFVGVGTVHEYDSSIGKLSESSPLKPHNV